MNSRGADPNTLRIARPWVLAAVVLLLIVSNALETVLLGDGLERWWPTVNKPAWLLPDWGFVPIGLYFGVAMGTAIYRSWPASQGIAQVRLALTGAILIMNAAWNYVFFAQRNPSAGLYLLAVYAVVVWSLVVVCWRSDRVLAWVLLPYALYTPYAVAFSWALVRLNPSNGL